MSRKPVSDGDSLDPIPMAGRRLSCETIMFHQAVADRLGLNVTDHKCLDFLLLHGARTAGDLAQMTSLTTGAITAVLDRLEKAGFVRREHDPEDRRRVIVHPVIERVAEIGVLFVDLSQRVQELMLRYSKAEQSVIVDFMNRSCDILHAAALNLKNTANEPSTSASQQRAGKKAAPKPRTLAKKAMK